MLGRGREGAQHHQPSQKTFPVLRNILCGGTAMPQGDSGTTPPWVHLVPQYWCNPTVSLGALVLPSLVSSSPCLGTSPSQGMSQDGAMWGCTVKWQQISNKPRLPKPQPKAMSDHGACDTNYVCTWCLAASHRALNKYQPPSPFTWAPEGYITNSRSREKRKEQDIAQLMSKQ